ncbi:hypothetical protein [Lysinibacter sp. HNR]|uniref:hypothetical protein n=1 Tax=Lysinibacter sp. HNR TaxID=3031408 RepID=UPI00243573ED|nr:hypothetical protein [Lysinibacter sp. HNR]WGD36787.1 hypothetical protein FrondiHNR_10010 [Lysinibacter sp. HNR]
MQTTVQVRDNVDQITRAKMRALALQNFPKGDTPIPARSAVGMESILPSKAPQQSRWKKFLRF